MEKYYYFLACSLPNISISQKPDLTFEELKNMIYLNFQEDDLRCFELFLKFIDLNNFRLFWQNKEIDPRGSLSVSDLEDYTLSKYGIFDFVSDFLEMYETVEERLRNFTFLLVKFFDKVFQEQKGFLHKYFKLEKLIRLNLTALRSKKIKKDIVYELKFEDLSDEYVVYILTQKDQDNFEPTKEFEEIKNIYLNNIDDPKKMNLELLKFKYDKMIDFFEEKPFTKDQIIAYAILLYMIENYYKLDIEEGIKIAQNL